MKITTLSILERVDASNGSFSATVTEEEFAVFEKLAGSGDIVGQIGPECQDDPDTMIEAATLTAHGRATMHSLRNDQKKPGTNWAMISALIALAGFCGFVLWKLVEVNGELP